MPNAALTRAVIVNRALMKLGQAASFTDDAADRRAGKVDLVWPGVVARCFNVHGWSFATRTRRLTRRVQRLLIGYAYSHDLPPAIGPMAAFYADPNHRNKLRDFQIEEGCISSDSPDVWASYKVFSEPEYWDEGFVELVATVLAGALAVPLQQDQDLAQQYMAEAFGTPSQGGAGGMAGRLIAQDLAANPPRNPFDDGDPLTDARWR